MPELGIDLTEKEIKTTNLIQGFIITATKSFLISAKMSYEEEAMVLQLVEALTIQTNSERMETNSHLDMQESFSMKSCSAS